ncbi:MAG: hypothetical protein JNL12_05735 [Planctomycetes bacterium]|nr:hypothetical protein [Planctomycetota bacterium]
MHDSEQPRHRASRPARSGGARRGPAAVRGAGGGFGVDFFYFDQYQPRKRSVEAVQDFWAHGLWDELSRIPKY